MSKLMRKWEAVRDPSTTLTLQQIRVLVDSLYLRFENANQANTARISHDYSEIPLLMEELRNKVHALHVRVFSFPKQSNVK